MGGDLDMVILVATENSAVPIVALEFEGKDTGGGDARVKVVGNDVGPEEAAIAQALMLKGIRTVLVRGDRDSVSYRLYRFKTK